MNKLLIVSIVIFTLAAEGTDGTRVVTGFVRDVNGNPLIGATVMVPGLRLGDMTDSSGEYLIADIPIENLRLQAQMVGLGEVTRELALVSGDTVFVDFTLSRYGAPRIVTFKERMNREEYPDTLEIFVENWLDVDMEHSAVWYRNMLLPSWKATDSTITALLPRRADSLYFTVFPAGECLILKNETPT
jgi:hypothetical protein